MKLVEPLLTKKDVARRLAVSERSVDRMRDEKKMPLPFLVGNLPRWNPEALEAWIADGCKAVK